MFYNSSYFMFCPFSFCFFIQLEMRHPRGLRCYHGINNSSMEMHALLVT